MWEPSLPGPEPLRAKSGPSPDAHYTSHSNWKPSYGFVGIRSEKVSYAVLPLCSVIRQGSLSASRQTEKKERSGARQPT